MTTTVHADAPSRVGENGSVERVVRADSNRVIALIAGVLFITATVADLISTGLLNPLLGSSDYLVKIFANQDRVLVGVFFGLIGAFAAGGIAISLYPILRRYNDGLALGSVGFRLLEAALYLVGALGVLLLVTLSQDFARAGAPSASYFQTSGALLREFRDQANLASTLAFYLGAAMYYVVFYQSRLIPRWLSGWGLVGVTLGAAAALLVLFRVTGFMSTPQVVLNLPIAVQEMVLAVWLIVKGFSPSAFHSQPRRLRQSTASLDLRDEGRSNP